MINQPKRENQIIKFYQDSNCYNVNVKNGEIERL